MTFRFHNIFPTAQQNISKFQKISFLAMHQVFYNKTSILKNSAGIIPSLYTALDTYI